MARSARLRRNGNSYKHSGRCPALRDPFQIFSGDPREGAKPCVHKASPCGGGVGEADGGGSYKTMASSLIFDPKTPPTDRCAIASPTGGGFVSSAEPQSVLSRAP